MSESAADWLDVLRAACAETSQAAVARQLGISSSTINQALKGTYKGNLSRLKTLVEGRLMKQTVECPVIGELAKHQCQEHQAREGRFITANPLTMRLYRACRSGCPHSKLPQEY
jgi:transcriptional regulator with XRE-family HTH domain